MFQTKLLKITIFNLRVYGLLLLGAILQIAFYPAIAQQSTITHKIYLPNTWLASVRADYYFNNKSFAFFKAERQQIKNAAFDFSETFSDELWLTGGYEWRYSPKWFNGIAAYVYGTKQPNGSLFYLNGEYAWLGHRGFIYKKGWLEHTEVIKEFTIQRQNPKGESGAGSYNPGMVQLGFKLAIVKPVKLGARSVLRPAIGMQLFRQYYDDEDKNPYKRFIDESRFRIDINYLPQPNLVINLFAMRRTGYLPIKDNTNLVYPTYGIGLTYFIDRHDIADKILKNN